MLGGGTVKQLYELKGEGRSIRAIARDLGVSRNSVRKYLRSPQVPKAKEQAPRGSKLDPYKEYLRERLAEGLENCVVLLRELRRRGYTGGYSILKEYVHPSYPLSAFDTMGRPGESSESRSWSRRKAPVQTGQP